MAHIRWYRPDHAHEVCIRTIDGRFFLDPEGRPELAEAIHAMFARAQARYGVEIYGYFVVSNHYHGLFRAPDADSLARFLNHLHSAMAVFVNHGLNRTGPVFGGGSHVVAVALDEETLTSRLAYIMGQGVKARRGLGIEDWPGADTNSALMHGTPVVGRYFDRHRETLDRRLKEGAADAGSYTSQPEVKLSPLPCWQGLAEVELRERYRAVAAEAERRYGGPLVQHHVSESESPTVDRDEPPVPVLSEEVPGRSAAEAALEGRPPPRRVDRRGARALLIHASTASARETYRAEFDAVVAAWTQARERLVTEIARAVRGKAGRAVVFPAHTFPGVVRCERARCDARLGDNGG